MIFIGTRGNSIPARRHAGEPHELPGEVAQIVEADTFAYGRDARVFFDQKLLCRPDSPFDDPRRDGRAGQPPERVREVRRGIAQLAGDVAQRDLLGIMRFDVCPDTLDDVQRSHVGPRMRPGAGRSDTAALAGVSSRQERICHAGSICPLHI